MKKRIIMLFGAVIVMAGIVLTVFLSKPVDVEAKVLNNFKEMGNLYTFETILSSNPYDYVDNEYYDNIVDMGVEALDTLEGIVNSEEWSGREQYVAAIAMQEITQCDLYKITGKDWSTAEEFKGSWKEMMEKMPMELQEIYSDQVLTESEKKKKLKQYGVFSEAYASNIEVGNDAKSFEFAGREIAIADIDDAKHIAEDLKETISRKETTIVSDYLSKYQN